MFFRAVTTPLMTPVFNFNKRCAVSNFLFKNIDFCIFTPKTPLVKENYFLTLWNFTYLKDTSFGKTSCNFEHGLETKNEFEKWPLITFFQCSLNYYVEIFRLLVSCFGYQDRCLFMTQTGLQSHRRWLEAGNFRFRKKKNCTIHVAKAKALISFAVTAKLICTFAFAYADC